MWTGWISGCGLQRWEFVGGCLRKKNYGLNERMDFWLESGGGAVVE